MVAAIVAALAMLVFIAIIIIVVEHSGIIIKEEPFIISGVAIHIIIESALKTIIRLSLHFELEPDLIKLLTEEPISNQLASREKCFRNLA